MGCGNEVTKEDFEKIEEASQGKHTALDETKISPETWEEVNKKTEEAEQVDKRIDEQIRKMKDIHGAKPINDVIIQHEGDDVSEEEVERLVDRIQKSDVNDAILIMKEEGSSPFFTPGFNDVGDEVEFSGDKELPSGKVYSPIQPTIENLGNLLDERNPYNPWDEKVTWHHYEQKEEPIMIIEQRLHQKESGAIHGYNPLNRGEWDGKQRGEFMKEIARQYLGKYSEHKTVLKALKMKAKEARMDRIQKE